MTDAFLVGDIRVWIIFVIQGPLPEEAPPQMNEEAISEFSDVFSFGILLIFLFNLSTENSTEIVETAKNSPTRVKKPKFAEKKL